VSIQSSLRALAAKAVRKRTSEWELLPGMAKANENRGAETLRPRRDMFFT
jgi:hypothetical protein